MGLIFQGICGRCGSRAGLGTPVRLAVFVDGAIEGAERKIEDRVVWRRQASVGVSEGVNLVELSHPIEGAIMDQHGFTWEQLRREGRFVKIYTVICRRCGKVFEKRKLEAMSPWGCLWPMVIGLVCGVVAGVVVWMLSGGPGALMAGAVVWFAVFAAVDGVGEWLGRRHLRKHFVERAKLVAGRPECPVCGVDDSVGIDRVGMAVCTLCGERAMKEKAVAIS